MKKTIIAFICMMFYMLNAKGQDSTDAPITNRIALAYFPFNNVGLSYCFGNKGRFKVEDVLKPTFDNKNAFPSSFSNEIKLLYSWKSCGHKKLHSGIGVQMEKQHNFNHNYLYYIPIGIEVFTSNRAPCIGLTLDSSWNQPSGLGLHFGISYYF